MLQILAVEDNPEDVIWLKVVLAETGIDYRLVIASNGEQAVDCLTHQGIYRDVPEPDLILLDMHLPKFGGLEILKRVPESAKMPFCALTTSAAEESAVRAHFQRPVCYHIKPLSLDKFSSCMRSLGMPGCVPPLS